jgi:broad specificity phosphatase PhoE
MIQEVLKQYSDEQRLSLLIRHGDRDHIPEGSFGNEVQLNEKGKYNSLKFGESLAELKVNRIFTSPVGRCVQTAEQISKGYGNSIDIIETTALGDPGIPIFDDKLAGEYYLQHGGFGMYQHFTQGKKISGVLPIEEIKISMTDFINKNTTENGLTLFVSHDMIIAMYHYCLNKMIYTPENWVNYLSGITLKNGEYEK